MNELASQSKYANASAREISRFLEQRLRGLYHNVLLINPEDRPYTDPPNLYVHRSEPWIVDRRVIFNLYIFDDGDLAYEPRLQRIEEVLRERGDVHKIVRAHAPDNMLKEMLNVEVMVPERRKVPRLAQVDGGNAK